MFIAYIAHFNIDIWSNANDQTFNEVSKSETGRGPF